MTKPRPIEPIRKRPEYLEVAASGKKWVEKGLIVQFLPPQTDKGPVRVGLTVSSRTGNAVKRSRIKRRLRALIREVFPTEGLSGGSYVVIGRAATYARGFEDLRKDLKKALLSLHSREQKGKQA